MPIGGYGGLDPTMMQQLLARIAMQNPGAVATRAASAGLQPPMMGNENAAAGVTQPTTAGRNAMYGGAPGAPAMGNPMAALAAMKGAMPQAQGGGGMAAPGVGVGGALSPQILA